MDTLELAHHLLGKKLMALLLEVLQEARQMIG